MRRGNCALKLVQAATESARDGDLQEYIVKRKCSLLWFWPDKYSNLTSARTTYKIILIFRYCANESSDFDN